MHLASGTELRLGAGDPESRLRRFARVATRLVDGQTRAIERVDLRYSDGFAVRWGANAEPAPANGDGANERNGVAANAAAKS